ncbi:meiosis-specific with OB domain-containing protein-like isoform X2 [Corticium candelabrum]|uniref:meiosis-specific with OB domain-containing protein-like isoform X2 n=1 Tax=Corticium candelabrum TaxID=121492 RepID=UPI002E25886C|nr:meiosis-specific with OB domain-containing protein-like isoform X2 [Corticium candelabrum]
MYSSSDFHPFGTQRTWPDGSSLNFRQFAVNIQDRVTGRTLIRDLSPNLPQCVVVGVVLAKEEGRLYADKKNPGQTRSRMGFTIRDSPDDYINVTVWGSQAYIDKLSSSFKICDVVEISNCQVQAKQSEEIEERFKPWTPGPYHLHLKEMFSAVSLYNGNDFAELMSLAHVPTREDEGFNSLGQLVENADNVQDQHVHFMAAVQHIGVGRKVVTKSGREVTCCEIKLFDKTCPSFTLMLWDQETIHLAQGWTAGETIVLVTDAKIKYDNYKRTQTATSNAKTIIVTNPDTHYAHCLFQFAQSTPIRYHDDGSTVSDDSFMQQQTVDLNSIKDMYTVETWRKTVCGLDGLHQTCHGVMIAVLTHIGLPDCITRKCSLCKRRVESESHVCQNRDCASFQHPTTVETSFDFLIVLSDHSGSTTCRIFGAEAEALLACTPDEYLLMRESAIELMRWKLQLEWVKVYLQAFISPTRTIPSVRVLSCCLADVHDMKVIQ